MMQETNDKPSKVTTRDRSIDCMRGIAFLLVLVGHSFPDSAYDFISLATQLPHDYIYSFHMPLFFIISGFCMHHIMMAEELDVSAQIGKRIKRIAVPYLFWSYIAIVPKIVFASIMYLPFTTDQLWGILLGDSPSGTLWYLWTLFVVNCMFILISRVTRKPLVWLVIGIVLYALGQFVSVPYLHRILDYTLWFTIGAMIADKWSIIKPRAQMRRGMLVAIVLLVANLGIVLLFMSMGIQVRHNLVSSLIGCTAVLIISIRISECSGRIMDFIMLSSKYSYGIYLLSPWPQVGIRVFLYAKLGFPYMICMALMIVLGFVIPYAVLKLVEKFEFPGKNVLKLIVGL